MASRAAWSSPRSVAGPALVDMIAGTSARVHVPSSTARRLRCAAVQNSTREPALALPMSDADADRFIRDGGTENKYVARQAAKKEANQRPLSSTLAAFRPGIQTLDVVIVGAGPAGLRVAACLAEQGLKVVLVGRDAPFVNNYGVWVDEIAHLGLDDAIEREWDSCDCYFGEENHVIIPRRYARLDRTTLRTVLAQQCRDRGVPFLATEVTSIEAWPDAPMATVKCEGGVDITSRLVVVCSGPAGANLLEYGERVAGVAAQTAYGIEADVEGYENAYNPDKMIFMDFRRHHTGVWEGTAGRIVPGSFADGGNNDWGVASETPSFNYAMRIGPGSSPGTQRVFLEETCLVSREPLPFEVLRRRLKRRLDALGIQVKKVYDEEWSYIPVGGPIPCTQSNTILAYGAAANMVHPATGYSVTRSLVEAEGFAKAVADALEDARWDSPMGPVAQKVWSWIWSDERQAQRSFQIFGMELLCDMDVRMLSEFFITFFRLPPHMWQGFLATRLTSTQLITFALATFFYATWGIRKALTNHLFSSPTTSFVVSKFTKALQSKSEQTDKPQVPPKPLETANVVTQREFNTTNM